MPPDDSDLLPPPTIDKGKRRAEDPTERTPLLQDEAYGSTSSDTLPFTDPPSSRRRLQSVLTTVFLVSLSVCIIIVVLLAILAYSYAARASQISPDRILSKDVVLSGPFHVDILNTTDNGGIWLNVSGRMGFDAGDALGVSHPGVGEGDALFEGVWKAIGRWSIRKLDTVTVELNTVHVSPHDDSDLLLGARFPPIEVPLTVDPPRRSKEWLSPVVTEVFVKPTRNATVLAKFITESWQHGSFDVSASVGEVVVRGGRKGESWKDRFQGKLMNVQTSIRVKIPPMPGLPQPGKHAPFPSVSDFLTLKTFRVLSQNNLTIHAEADIINPVPKDFHFAIPSLPFTVSLPTNNDSRLTVANIITHPFESTHPNITLYLSGTVPALPKPSFPLLSTFLGRYLNAEPNPILISTPLFPLDSSGAPQVEIPAEFPAPSERPQLLQDVTIKDMKIRPSGTTFLASGIVFAKVVLPRGMDVGVDVFRVFPDVLVFDGEVPSLVGHSLRQVVAQGELRKKVPPEMPDLPDPLPERAFGHIRPDDWLPSTSVRLESDDGGDDDGDGDERETGAIYAVSAKVVDVPLQVLPGRQKQFSNFVGKVIFGSGGAVAGIQGHAAVTVEVDGLPLDPGDPSTGGRHRKGGEDHGDGGATLELTGLPFRGSVRVGKKSL
ncbi:hypothetical protein P691DRAFT_805621 [Macrolepiota fuliginosa MF-IS2]|uniref:Uncharacterized protein n=1 Tax=Macrolepiota fuliginosa MF-IS2 TaxID=1400762 RepID=A0A9P5XM52_9AGAR|nr:hypothetical protein P691DRAFT_805621 [Macrolepiota fuliginosa MF-IS2]